jgi:hypothetical protein
MSTYMLGSAIIFLSLSVSGAASINNDGKTVYRNDGEGQIDKTLDSINNLLCTQQSQLNDTVMGTAFCKDEKSV